MMMSVGIGNGNYGFIANYGDISDDLSGVATGKAIVWDASLNKWLLVMLEVRHQAAKSTNIRQLLIQRDPLTAGKLYYDTSWNSFHGNKRGWQRIIISNTNILFGAPHTIQKNPFKYIGNCFSYRFEFTWENPPQYATGFSASIG